MSFAVCQGGKPGWSLVGGWAGEAESIHQGKALCVMRAQDQFPGKFHKSSGYFKMSEEREHFHYKQDSNI